jgi:hypothetical protein
MEPEAADSLAKMMAACGNRIEVTDGFRSVLYQIESIREQKTKRRLFAKPTKSGHNFGFSIDIKIAETLENFRKSKIPELVAAGRDRAALVRWMKKFGWTGIKKESWHFNFLGEHESTAKKIEALYAKDFELDNEGVQKALNKLVGSELEEPLELDGVLALKTSAAAKIADKVLNLNDRGAFSAWFRRVLAGATMEIQEASS